MWDDRGGWGQARANNTESHTDSQHFFSDHLSVISSIKTVRPMNEIQNVDCGGGSGHEPGSSVSRSCTRGLWSDEGVAHQEEYDNKVRYSFCPSTLSF